MFKRKKCSVLEKLSSLCIFVFYSYYRGWGEIEVLYGKFILIYVVNYVIVCIYYLIVI